MRYALLVLLLAGCASDLANGTLVDRPRVLGARLEIAGDPGRASPRAGEHATLRILTAPPETEWLGLAFACFETPRHAGLPSCAAPPFASFDARASTLALELDVPPDAAPGSSILFSGVLCSSGVPAIAEGELPRCEGEGADGEVFTYSVALAGEQPNHHPSAPVEIAIDGTAWAAPDADLPVQDCASREHSASLPQIDRREEEEPSPVTFVLDASDHEVYRVPVYRDEIVYEDRVETLSIAHVATAGRFSRRATDLQADAFEGGVPWRHPAADEIPEGGLTVRFWIVVRDGRGGMDWIERAACVR
jgi:hypothetical protein